MELDLKKIVAELKAQFATGKSKVYETRIRNLLAIKTMLSENETELTEALASDLGRSSFDTLALETMSIVSDIDYIVSNLKSWIKPQYTTVPIMLLPATSEVVYEPYGVALIIGAFNYPVNLVLSPLVGAICAGNCCVIKPSELAPACEAFLVKILPKYLDNDCYKIVCGGVEVTKALLSQHWDKIFFTGSTRVGKIVMQAASAHLTPVSLELGGKSPTIIDESARDIELAVQRILWGKFANAGQTCIAPDYVLCHEKHYEEFLRISAKTITQFFGSDPRKSLEYGRIISKAHCERLKKFVDDLPAALVSGGEVILEERYMQPTIVANPSLNSLVMQEEIFGPILPVIKVKDCDEIISIVKTMEKPLALYIFSTDRKMIDRVTNEISSGAVLVNDVMMHFASSAVPFGGIGPSGLGSYHGKYSLQCFSHLKTIIRRDDHRMFDIQFLKYPQFHSDIVLKIFRLSTKLPDFPAITPKMLRIGVAGCVIATSIAWYGPQNLLTLIAEQFKLLKL